MASKSPDIPPDIVGVRGISGGTMSAPKEKKEREAMTIRRLFWMLARPFAWLGHRLGLWSLAPVNVAVLAWRRDLGDALMHYEYFGTPVAALPEEVGLSGIPYRTAVSEGTVIFTCDFTRNRIVFERDPHDPLSMLWYVSLGGTYRHAATHVDAAYRWIRAVFGGSFVHRAKPLRSGDGL